MVIYFIAGAVLLTVIFIFAIRSLKSRTKQKDSMLKQRAIFTTSEYLTFTRLKEILPDYTILAHVPFDALLTTKFNHTRNKYRNMVADFVVLGNHYEIIAIVAVDEHVTSRRIQDAQYQDELLKVAGYKVCRFDDVPEYKQLREAFKEQQKQKDIKIKNEDILFKTFKFYSGRPQHKLNLIG